MIELRVAMQTIPQDHKGGYDLESKHVTITAETYDQAHAEARAQVPEGWRLVSIRVDRN